MLLCRTHTLKYVMLFCTHITVNVVCYLYTHNNTCCLLSVHILHNMVFGMCTQITVHVVCYLYTHIVMISVHIYWKRCCAVHTLKYILLCYLYTLTEQVVVLYTHRIVHVVVPYTYIIAHVVVLYTHITVHVVLLYTHIKVRGVVLYTHYSSFFVCCTYITVHAVLYTDYRTCCAIHTHYGSCCCAVHTLQYILLCYLYTHYSSCCCAVCVYTL